MAKFPKRPEKKSEIDHELVRELAKLLEETNLTEIEYGRDGWRVRVAKHARPTSVHVPATTGAPATTDALTAEAAPPLAVLTGPGVVRSPMVGVAYTASDPNEPPFIKVGDKVERGQTVLLIEAMKVFNAIEAPIAGTVVRIFVSNGAPVEYDEPLLLIE